MAGSWRLQSFGDGLLFTIPDIPSWTFPSLSLTLAYTKDTSLTHNTVVDTCKCHSTVPRRGLPATHQSEHSAQHIYFYLHNINAVLHNHYTSTTSSTWWAVGSTTLLRILLVINCIAVGNVLGIFLASRKLLLEHLNHNSLKCLMAIQGIPLQIYSTSGWWGPSSVRVLYNHFLSTAFYGFQECIPRFL